MLASWKPNLCCIPMHKYVICMLTYMHICMYFKLVNQHSDTLYPFLCLHLDVQAPFPGFPFNVAPSLFYTAYSCCQAIPIKLLVAHNCTYGNGPNCLQHSHTLLHIVTLADSTKASNSITNDTHALQLPK